MTIAFSYLIESLTLTSILSKSNFGNFIEQRILIVTNVEDRKVCLFAEDKIIIYNWLISLNNEITN